MDDGYHSRRPESRQMLAMTRNSTSGFGSRSFLRHGSDRDRKSQFHLAVDERRLPPPAVFWSDNERDAYRKNKIIQSKLNSDLDDIRLHKQHSSRVIRCDALRFRLHSTRFPHLTPLKFCVWGNYKQMPRHRSIQSGHVGNITGLKCSPVGDDTLSCIVASSPERQTSMVQLTPTRQTTHSSLHRNSSLRRYIGEAQSTVGYKRLETSPVRVPDLQYHTKLNVDKEQDDRIKAADNGSHLHQLKDSSKQDISDNVRNGDFGASIQDNREDSHGHNSVSSSILSKKKASGKKVRWSNPEYSFLRSRTTLDDPSKDSTRITRCATCATHAQLAIGVTMFDSIRGSGSWQESDCVVVLKMLGNHMLLLIAILSAFCTYA
ncbi:uncharacterized protein LOC125373351 [Haliotis rufescens]|uniref:uncharacterized protein LOC125373351 n=1 Tax=Haliotis rufescens TaxID=6454 RepID=UPI00201F9B4E|nr:uncharacterized protein LOC125373351 [Haliotis rufescens]